MIGEFYRPWGELDWLIGKFPDIKWKLISCLSIEDRTSATIDILAESKSFDSGLFIKVLDPPSAFSKSAESLININERKLLKINSNITIEECHLLEKIHVVIDIVNNFVPSGSENILLDISTFPKRFFFPILKTLLKKNIKNLIVSYSNPLGYCNTELSFNPNPWEHLPLFMPTEHPEPTIDAAFVGVGFMPFSLPNLLGSHYTDIPVNFLFPFPPGPPNYQRTWDFMRKIEKSYTFKQNDKIIRLSSNNVSDAFEIIKRESEYGSKHVLFAPYGPKPVSLAMALYASLNSNPVYYTQPTMYNPHYSKGIGNVYGFCITIKDSLLY